MVIMKVSKDTLEWPNGRPHILNSVKQVTR